VSNSTYFNAINAKFNGFLPTSSVHALTRMKREKSPSVRITTLLDKVTAASFLFNASSSSGAHVSQKRANRLFPAKILFKELLGLQQLVVERNK